MDRSLVTLLTKPDGFFLNLNTEPESLGVPALFVLTSGLVGAISAYLIAGLTGKMMSAIMPGMESITGIIAVVSAIIGSFIFWGIVAGVFYVISSSFKGTGTFNRCLEVVGYGFLPQVIGALVAAVYTIMTVPSISVPSLSRSVMNDPQALNAAITAFMHDPAIRMVTQISAVVSIVFILWSAYIWVYGIKEARGLSLRDAQLCVGIPVLLYIIYLVYSVTLA
ncbi:MAG TPA: YIP1 family protein [Methanoregulaceae archaeon]|nr:YIP1 family protein [Methanoregulaceae archaeon]HPD75221.1 YIP1 family protein [Methanoregulaceae archaeon]HRY74986.1 YIP1 family protein [Methanoregulaceae archaeon]